MKLVYCIYGTFNSGGMERVLSIKANYLVEIMKYEVHIVTTNQQGQSSFFEISPLIKTHDLDINYAGENENSIRKKIIPFLSKQKKHKRELTKLLFEISPDVTISMFGNEMFFINDIKDGSRKIIEAHFSRFHRLHLGRKGIFRLADFIRDKLNMKLCKKFHTLVVLTEEDKNYWTNFNNIKVIPNPSSIETTGRANLSAKQVISVGRYTYQKGFDMLIDIWNVVHEENPDWKLKIIGNGILHEELKNKIKYYNLEDTIELKKTESDQIVHEYLSSSIYALPSRYEGFPMVLLEAASCGLPIVAFSCKCGPKDIVDHGINGLLVEEQNIADFAFSLNKLMNNYELIKTMGDNIYVTAKRYSLDSIMMKWKNLFEHNL